MLIDTFNTNFVTNVENKIITSTKSQSQSIPYFYKIVSEQKSNVVEKNTKVIKTKTVKSKKTTNSA